MGQGGWERPHEQVARVCKTPKAEEPALLSPRGPGGQSQSRRRSADAETKGREWNAPVDLLLASGSLRLPLRAGRLPFSVIPPHRFLGTHVVQHPPPQPRRATRHHCPRPSDPPLALGHHW